MELIYISIFILIVLGYILIIRKIRKSKEYSNINGRLVYNDFGHDNGKGEHFDWNEVKIHFGKVLERENFKYNQPCPNCNLPSEKLVWINYSTPRRAWRHLAGSAGPLSICPSCKIQVEFLCYKNS